jgi:hypothetical protein
VMAAPPLDTKKCSGTLPVLGKWHSPPQICAAAATAVTLQEILETSRVNVIYVQCSSLYGCRARRCCQPISGRLCPEFVDGTDCRCDPVQLGSIAPNSSVEVLHQNAGCSFMRMVVKSVAPVEMVWQLSTRPSGSSTTRRVLYRILRLARDRDTCSLRRRP